MMEMLGDSGISASFLERRGIEPVVLAHGGVTKVLRALSNGGAKEWCATRSNGARD